jgi:cell division transport system permease protein
MTKTTLPIQKKRGNKSRPKLNRDPSSKNAAGSNKNRKPPTAYHISRLRARQTTSIVPRETIAGNALTLVIGIMTFLVCITFGAVSLINDTASAWKNDIAREVTIQIRPEDGINMEEALLKAQEIASGKKGISSVTIINEEETARLLEPWLGTGLSLDDLPVPRLLSVKLETGERPNFEELRQQLVSTIPNASLDDHQAWSDRLTTMAGATVLIGLAIMALVMCATILTVVFATKGAMSSNQHIVEVLHFVGARDKYVANQFQRHFLMLGLKGGAIGGILAALVFLIIGYWTGQNIATPEGDQVTALFGTFTVGLTGYAGAMVIVILVAMLTAVTSRTTVFRHLNTLDRN